jgi:glycosyltransferase involved in cell wall biosynthesis
VIAYPHGSVPEIVDDGISGFLVHDQEEATRAVARISEIDRKGCRKRFEERFTARRMTQDYLALYERLVNRQSRSIVVRGRVPVG